MSTEYSSFIYDQESVILKPGEQFSINELKSRLNQMGIYANNLQDKSELKNLYESSLQNNANKIKIFDKLKKDTEVYYKYQLKNKKEKPNDIKLNVKMNKELNLSNDLKNEKKVQLKRANKIIDKDDNVDYILFDNEYNKIPKLIMFHILFGFIIISSFMVFLYIYRIYSEEINSIISRFFAFMTNFNHYWYLLPLIFIPIIIYIFIKFFGIFIIKKKCEKILKKMKENSDNNNNELSDEYIYRTYVKNVYGISYKTFIRKYSPVLKKMRKRDKN